MSRVAYHITPPSFLADVAVWWLNPPPTDWDERSRERCEEHIQFSSYDDTRIHVVGQMKLPTNPAASLPREGGEHLYLIPYFWLGKAQPRTSPYEVSGPEGHVTPTYTRAQNTKLTVYAFERFARTILKASSGLVRDYANGTLQPAEGKRAQIPLHDLLHRLAVSQAAQASTSLRLIVEQLAMENGGADLDHGHLPKGRCLQPKAGVTDADLRNYELLLRDIAAGELLWVPVLGCPGSEARLELSYTTRATKLALFRRRAPTRVVSLYESRLDPAQSHSEPVVPLRLLAREPLKEDDRRDRTTTRRLWNRIAHLFGYAPYETIFGASAMHRWSSYHLHVDSPPGIEIRAAQLLTRLSWSNGKPGHVRSELSVERAHLVVSRAQLSDQASLRKPMPVRIRMRTAERHVTYFAAGMALLVAVMLWTLAVASQAAEVHNTSAVSEILVIVPALLLIFAARPGEHGMARRVLAGVRGLVLLSGACCVAAAVVLASGSWSTNNTGLREHLMVIAGLASLIAGFLLLNLLLSIRALDGPRLKIDRRFDDARWEEKERRGANLQPDKHEAAARATPHKGSHDYQNLGAILWALQLGATIWLCLVPGVFSTRHLAELTFVSLVLLFATFPSAVLAARGEATRTTRPPGTAGVLGCTALLTFVVVILAAVSEIFGVSFPAEIRWLFPLAILLLPPLFQLIGPLPWLRREKDNEASQPGYDYIVASAEGDHEETDELVRLLDKLTSAIVNQRAAFRPRLRERLGIVRPDDEKVFIDVEPPPEPRDG